MRYFIKHFKDIHNSSCDVLIKFKELEDLNDTTSRMKILDPDILKVRNHQATPVIKVNYDLPHDPKYTFLIFSEYWSYFTIKKAEINNILEFNSDEEALLYFEVYDG